MSQQPSASANLSLNQEEEKDSINQQDGVISCPSGSEINCHDVSWMQRCSGMHVHILVFCSNFITIKKKERERLWLTMYSHIITKLECYGDCKQNWNQLLHFSSLCAKKEKRKNQTRKNPSSQLLLSAQQKRG